MMNEEQITTAGSHDGDGTGTGDGGGGNVGGRNDEVGFKIFLDDPKHNYPRREVTVDKIYSDLHTSRHPNDMKALIGLLLEGGFLSHKTQLTNNNNPDDHHDNHGPAVDNITMEDYQKIVVFIFSNFVTTVPIDYDDPFVEWDVDGRITSLLMKPKNCYGESMTSYRVGRSVGRLDKLVSLHCRDECYSLYGFGYCESIPMELSALKNLCRLDLIFGPNERFPPVQINGLKSLVINCYDSNIGWSEWLSTSKFPNLEIFIIKDHSERRASATFVLKAILGISKSAGQRLRIISIGGENASIGAELVDYLPKYVPNLKELRFEYGSVLDLPAIAAKLQATDYHPDFERATAVNLRGLDLTNSSTLHNTRFKNNKDTEAMVTILSHFKRVDFVGLDLKSRRDDNDDTKRLNKKLEYLLKVNHSNGRVLIPGCNDSVLEKVGTQISHQRKRKSCDEQNIDSPKLALPLSAWPKILESAWKKSKMLYASSEDDGPNTTAIHTLLRPCCGSNAVGPCLAHLLNEADTNGQSTDPTCIQATQAVATEQQTTNAMEPTQPSVTEQQTM